MSNLMPGTYIYLSVSAKCLELSEQRRNIRLQSKKYGPLNLPFQIEGAEGGRGYLALEDFVGTRCSHEAVLGAGLAVL